jgi:hypothetical protein
MTASIVPPEEVPDLEPGINLVETSRVRTTSLHQVALGHLDPDGTAVWFDARGNAATYLLDQEFRRTPNLEIARAFTAYQHYELVRTLPGDLPRNLDLIVLPCVASLYCDEDVPDAEGVHYLESALAILDAVADVTDVPVLVSCLEDSPLVGKVRDAATKTITYEATAHGVRFVADDFETTVYWGDGFFQTTIPYWIELLGAVEEADPAVAVDESGVLPSIV